MFTTNRVQAAPVTLDRERLAAPGAMFRGVIANAGCANAVTGPRGLDDARRTARLAAAAIGAGEQQVLVLSTGVIGVFLDMHKLERGIATLSTPAALRAAGDAARAITTTDTVPKFATGEARLPGGVVRIAGFAKGAGMIHPDLATMLAVITTDASLTPQRLDRVLGAATRRSFNRISVDGDMSTNDTVIALASGVAGVPIEDAGESVFTDALTEVCASLARQIARDGEGATRLVELRVTGAANEAQAHRVGDAIARSPLVKTAVHGGDPNWGRVLAAAGTSGEAVAPERVRLWFGERDAVALLEGGLPVAFEDSDSAVFKFSNTLVNLLKTTAAGDLIDPATVATREAGSRFQLTIEVEDVDATCAELASRGVQLLNGPIDRPWGVRTASFRDPGGHIWEIAK